MTSDTQLLRHLCEADDPDQRQAMQADLAADATLASRARRLEDLLDAREPSDIRWPLPPAGVGWGMAMTASAQAMGDSRGHSLFFDDPADARLVVVLWDPDDSGTWQVLSPQGPDDQLSPGDLPLEAGARRRLDIVPPEGPSRWAVALPSLAHGPDWAAGDPWHRFRAGVYVGEVPVQTVRLPGRGVSGSA